jgi:hypothetical protein
MIREMKGVRERDERGEVEIEKITSRGKKKKKD